MPYTQLQLAKKVNEQIIRWSVNRSKLVVAIDGYTGVGKTTLLNNLSKINKNILPVNRDDFLISRSKLAKLFKSAKDKSRIFELNILDLTKMARLLDAYKSNKSNFSTKVFNPVTGKVDIPKTYDLTKSTLVVEGVFMFHPKLMNRLWNKRIYLDSHIPSIDRRRVLREKRKWGKNYFPETHPDSYFRQVTIALKRYNKKYAPKLKADKVYKI